MSNADLITRVEVLNKKIEAHNKARERTIGTLESYKEQFKELVEDYAKNFGVKITLENIEKVFKDERGRIEREIAEKETILQQIADGTYVSNTVDEVSLDQEIEDNSTETSTETQSVEAEDDENVYPLLSMPNEEITQTVNISKVKVKGATQQVPSGIVVDEFIETDGGKSKTMEVTADDEEITFEFADEDIAKANTGVDKFKDIKKVAGFDFGDVDFGGIDI